MIGYYHPFTHSQFPAPNTLTAGEFVTSGLVIGYKFDQGVGQVVTDYGPNGFNAQMGSAAGSDSNDPTWLSPRGIFCNGSHWIQMNTPNTILRLTNSLTIECKFKQTSAGSAGLFDKTGAGATNENYQLQLEAGNIRFRMVKADVLKDLTNSGYSLNTTYHVAATWDGSTMRMYVNGVDIGTTLAVAAPIDDIDGLAYSGTLGSSVFRLIGEIYKLAIYNRALTQSEITLISGL